MVDIQDAKKGAEDAVQTGEALWHKYSTYIGLACLVGFGTLFLLFGMRLLKITLFVAGFIVVGAIVFVAMMRYTSLELKWVLLASAGAGLVCGLATIWLFKVGVFLLGSTFGFWVSTFAFSITFKIDGKAHSLMNYLDDPWQYYLVVGICSLVCGLLALWNPIQKRVIIIATALGGSMAICLFIDYWWKTGFGEAAKTILTAVRFKDPKMVEISNWAWALVSLCVVLFVFGIWFQTRSKYRHNNEKNADQHHRVRNRTESI